MKKIRMVNPNNKVLYHLNYWDGPISGICLWNNEKQYFEMCNDEYEIRIYNVYDTPPNIIDKIENNHILFRKYVGTHTDYIDGYRHYNIKPLVNHKKFYSLGLSSKVDCKELKVIGSFTNPF